MKKNYYFLGMILVFLVSTGVINAQTDLTSRFLVNAGFDEQCIYAKNAEATNLGTTDNGSNCLAVYGWQIVPSGWAASASYEYGYAGWLNNQDNTALGVIPAAGYNNSIGGALGITVAWTGSVAYRQIAFLPAGSYTIEYATYNSGPSESNTSIVGWIPSEGDAVYSTKSGFALNEWEVDYVNMALTNSTSGTIQVGITSPNVGSGSVGRIFFDYVKLTCNSIDKTDLVTKLSEAEDLYNQSGDENLLAAMNALQAVIDGANDSPELIDKAINFVEAFSITKYSMELLTVLDRTEEVINTHDSNKYPVSAKNTLETLFVSILEKYEAGMIAFGEYPGYINQLNIAIDNYYASALGLKLHYDFSGVTGNTVPDLSPSGYNGTIGGDASVVTMGQFNVLKLGTNGDGYVDMGTGVGNVISTMENYTISAYFRVTETEALSGNGHFLWAFSTLNANSSGNGEYMFLRVPTPRATITSAGWNNEKTVSLGKEFEKGAWQHVVVRQTGTLTEVWVNGEMIASADNVLTIPAGNFTMPTKYNWIARPPFTDDSYLKNTLVYDFRVYNQSVPDADILSWASVVGDLDKALLNDAGDFTKLKALIAEYHKILDSATIGNAVGEYSETVGAGFGDAITLAEEFVTAGKGSQIIVDEELAKLQAAYATFIASANSMMVYPESTPPFQSGIYYIQVGDYFLTVPENGVNDNYLQLRSYIDNPEKLNNNQVWNIQFNPTYSDLGAENPYALFSIVSDVTVWEGDGNFHLDELGRMKDGGTSVAQSIDNNNWTWREHMIFFNGTAYSILNHYFWNQRENLGDNSRHPVIIFPNETEGEQASNVDTKKFQYIFRPVDDVVNEFSGIKTVNAGKVTIYGNTSEIVVSGVVPGTPLTVYDFSGRLVKATVANSSRMELNITPGLYIVKVANQVNKVIVR